MPPQYYGDPSQPFPWLTWNNRPFVSQWELMLVPACHPGRLLWEYATQYGPPKATRLDGPPPYQPATAAVPLPASPPMPYPHLLNFFWSERSGHANAPQLYRLFEYVNVPSRFVGTSVQADPAKAAAATGHLFYPPFNRISTYREPGRINLNTIYSQEVWQGLMNYFPTTIRLWRAGGGSSSVRAGWDTAASDTATTVDVLDDTATYLPTQFARPFRSFGGTALVPGA